MRSKVLARTGSGDALLTSLAVTGVLCTGSSGVGSYVMVVAQHQTGCDVLHGYLGISSGQKRIVRLSPVKAYHPGVGLYMQQQDQPRV